MFEIDMEAIEPIGEFGSRAWCDACASYGVKILEAADLPGDLNWGFSELYTYPPDRLISEDWSQSGYHFMVMERRSVWWGFCTPNLSGSGRLPCENPLGIYL